MEKRLYEKFLNTPVVASVRSPEQFEAVLRCDVEIVFLIGTTILTLPEQVSRLKVAGKTVFVHFDLLAGLSCDETGLEYLTRLVDIDGIITTRGNLCACCHRLGLAAIQRVFLIDTSSIDTAIANVEKFRPDAIELMPGTLPKAVSKIKSLVRVPIITGGIITEKQEIIDGLSAGAISISTTCEALWQL